MKDEKNHLLFDQVKGNNGEMAYKLYAAAKLSIGKKRATNEDNFYRSDFDPQVHPASGKLFIVADGVGGNKGGEEASYLACQRLPHHFFGSDWKDTTLVNRLEEAIINTHLDIHFEGQKNQSKVEMSCTMVVIAFVGDEVAFANLGDARIYRLRGETLKQLTIDHSMVQEQLQLGMLTAEQALNHPNKNAVTRTLGGSEMNKPDVWPVVVLPGDRFLLCSDGLHGPVPDFRIASLLGQDKPMQAVADDLVAEANMSGGPDNIGVLTLKACDPSGNAQIESEADMGQQNAGPIGLVPQLSERVKRSWSIFPWRRMN